MGDHTAKVTCAVDVREPEHRCFDAALAREGTAQGLTGNLACAVRVYREERMRFIDRQTHGLSVHLARAREDHPPRALLRGCLQHVVSTDDVRAERVVHVRSRAHHGRLRGEVVDQRRAAKGPSHLVEIANTARTIRGAADLPRVRKVPGVLGQVVDDRASAASFLSASRRDPIKPAPRSRRPALRPALCACSPVCPH